MLALDYHLAVAELQDEALVVQAKLQVLLGESLLDVCLSVPLFFALVRPVPSKNPVHILHVGGHPEFVVGIYCVTKADKRRFGDGDVLESVVYDVGS